MNNIVRKLPVVFIAAALIAFLLYLSAPRASHSGAQSFISADNFDVTQIESWRAVMNTANAINAADQDWLFVPIYSVTAGQKHDSLVISGFLKLNHGLSNLEKLQKAINAYALRLPEGCQISLEQAHSSQPSFVLDLRTPLAPGNVAPDYWYVRFQGSTGGSYTALELLMNFLQPGLIANWPEKVVFHHNGELPHFEHAGEDFNHLTRGDIEAKLQHFFQFSVPFSSICSPSSDAGRPADSNVRR